MTNNDEIIARIDRIRKILEDGLTGQGYADDEFRNLRAEVISDSRIRNLLPKFLLNLREAKHLYHQVKDTHTTYASRRQWLTSEFTPVLSYLETTGLELPVHETILQSLIKIDAQHVEDTWRKAVDRLGSDPEGAITVARALVESVCKFILESEGVDYKEEDNLPKLYKTTAKHLQLSPAADTEPMLRELLGGCATVVNGIASMRNRQSDAHGKGVKPAPTLTRHAKLAVTIGGGIAMFLIETWEGLLEDEGASLPRWHDDPDELQKAADILAQDRFDQEMIDEALNK